jgi:hypothetical protein
MSRACLCKSYAVVVGWAKARSAVPTKPLREARMSRYRRLKIEGDAFFYALTLADAGGAVQQFTPLCRARYTARRMGRRRDQIVRTLRRMSAWARRYAPLPTLRFLVDLQARRGRYIPQDERQIYAALCC